MRILVTGTAGFIGSAVALRLLARGDEVLGVDNVNDYYDVRLKEARLARNHQYSNFRELRADIADAQAMQRAFAEFQPQRVVHLAAQAGVRYSIENPRAYVDANVVGFLNILEGCRHHGVEHLVYASTSSVYGANTRMPFSVRDNIDHPVSLYAATKKADELMAHCYSWLYRMPVTGLRFFTVYGPWGRPDMALFLFTRNMLEGKPIQIFNHGQHSRDFTYIDDIVEGVLRTLDNVPQADAEWRSDDPDPSSSSAPYRIYNIGSNRPVSLMYFVEVLERCLGIQAEKEFLPLQPGDVGKTYADVTELRRDVGYQPVTRVEDGVARFVDWYKSFYGVSDEQPSDEYACSR